MPETKFTDKTKLMTPVTIMCLCKPYVAGWFKQIRIVHRNCLRPLMVAALESGQIAR